MKIRMLLRCGWILLSVPAVAQAQFDYYTNNGAITLTGYSGSSNNIILPDTVAGLPVGSVGSFYAFSSPTNITIPASITNIASGAFADLYSLTTFTVDPQNACYSSSGGVLFDKLQALLVQAPGGIAGTYVVPTNVASIGDEAFYYCSGLTALIIPNGVTNLGNSALANCGSLTNLEWGNNLASLGNAALQNCSQLTTVSIPASTAKIGTYAFAGCSSMTAIQVDAQNPAYSSPGGALCDKGQNTLIQVPGGWVGNYALPDSVTNVSNGALAGCAGLTAITVEATNRFFTATNGVLFDQRQAILIQFPGGLGGSYTVPAKTTRLGSTAFLGCAELTALTIPASVTNVGVVTFQNCPHAALFFQGNAPSITYSGWLGKINYLVPVFGNGFYNPTAAAVYYLPGTTGWGTTFDGIPAYLWVPPYVCLPASNSITIAGFNGSTNALVIPDEIGGLPVTAIANGAFDNAAGYALTNLTLGHQITSIGNYAFAACANLTSLTLPGSVTNLGNGIFAYCDNLQSVYFLGDAPSVGTSIFFRWPTLGIFPPVYTPPTPTTVYYLPGTTGWSGTFAGQPAVLWNPQAQTSDGAFGPGPHGFGFNLTGSSNLVVVVEGATSVTAPDWQPLQTLTLTAGSAYFSDPQWTNNPGRFYRFRSP